MFVLSRATNSHASLIEFTENYEKMNYETNEKNYKIMKKIFHRGQVCQA